MSRIGSWSRIGPRRWFEFYSFVAIRILFSKFLAFYKRATIRAEFVFFVIDEITSIREETGDREREREYSTNLYSLYIKIRKIWKYKSFVRVNYALIKTKYLLIKFRF